MRISNRPRGRRVTIHVNGRSVAAYEGESLFAVLLMEGVRALRRPVKEPNQSGRGGFCGMGLCQECRVSVDGMPERRACMTVVREGMEVVTDGG